VKAIIKDALEVKASDFLRLTEKILQMLRTEKGKIGNLQIKGHLVEVEPVGEAIVIGDIHGDIESLAYVLKNSGFMGDEDTLLIFLGDYGDRGAYSVEVYYTVMKLKLRFPERIVLMRGNHEGPEDLLAHPHDLPAQFEMRFGNDGAFLYHKIRELFPHMHNAVHVEKRFLMVHGGLPVEARSLEDLANAHETHPQETFLEEILWSDPYEGVKGVSYSPRGAGKVFGADVTHKLLKRFNVKILVRGHSPCMEGFRIGHNGAVLTLFSRRGPPYHNKFGAYLRVPLSEEFENAEQLVPYIYKF